MAVEDRDSRIGEAAGVYDTGVGIWHGGPGSGTVSVSGTATLPDGRDGSSQPIGRSGCPTERICWEPVAPGSQRPNWHHYAASRTPNVGHSEHDGYLHIVNNNDRDPRQQLIETRAIIMALSSNANRARYAFASTATASQMPLEAGQSLPLDSTYTGAVSFITDSGGGAITICALEY